MSIKKSNNEFDDNNNLSFYQNELAKKDKQISNLQKKINNLFFNKNSLIYQIDKSIHNNIPSLKNISPQNHYQKNKLYSSFQTSLYDNTLLLKNKLNINEQIGEKYNNTIQYKLLSAQREIENLTTMNTTKDKIIMNMQYFINNINKEVCNGKLNLNINNIDINTFIINLKRLEQKIIKKLKKIPKPNKIPESIIQKAKENSIRKQKTEVSLIKKKHLYIFPFNQRNNKLNTQANTNECKYYNNSFKKQNFTCQNYNKKPMKELKYIRSSTGRTNSKLKENKLKLKRYLLNKNQEIYNRVQPKKHMKSLDNKNNNENLKTITINNEMSFSRIYDNGNGIFHKKSSDK
jgi:hypothetical protein